MLLAQINRDSQGIAEFQNAGGDTQQVTLCLAEAVSGEFIHAFPLSVGILPSFQQSKKLLTHAVIHFSPLCHLCSKDGDQMDMDTVSLQAVTLADGSTAYIQHNPKGNSNLNNLHKHTVMESGHEGIGLTNSEHYPIK